MTNIKESINRGFNLLAVSITGIAGFAFLPEIFVESDWADKADDTLLLILGIAAMVWYARGTNKYTRSIVPVVCILVGLLIKITGLVIEISDPASFGDDIGGLILFVLATGLIIYQYGKVGQMAESA